MSTKKGNPGCPCCGCELPPDCEIYEDDFSSDTIANYSQNSGSWAVSGGSVTTSDTNAILLYDAELPESHSVCAAIKPPTDTSVQTVYRVILAWADSSNYLYGQIRCNTASGHQLSLREVIGGVDAEVMPEVRVYLNWPVVSATHILVTLCYLADSATLSYVLNTLEKTTGMNANAGGGYGTVSSPSALGTYAGIGTLAVPSGSASVTDFIVYSADENCNHCYCSVCDVGTSPKSIIVEFSKVADDECSECNLFNTLTFVLDRKGTSCAYVLTQLWTIIDCGQPPVWLQPQTEDYYSHISAFFSCDNPRTNENGRFTVRVSKTAAFPSSTNYGPEFRLTLDCCKIDCAGVLGGDDYYQTGEGVLIPLYSSNDNFCDWSNATCRVWPVL